MSGGLALLQRRLEVAARGAVPSPPASRLLQRSGLEAAVEQRLCGETLALTLEKKKSSAMKQVLIVDLSTTGRAAAVWVGHTLEFFAESYPQTRVTLALPGTRKAGRGRLLTRHLESASEKTGVFSELLCGPASVARSAPLGDEATQIRETFDLIMVVTLGGSAGIGAPWPKYQGRAWLKLADAAVLTFIDPDSLLADLDRFSLLDSGPPRIRVEALDQDEPQLLGSVDIAQLDKARKELPRIIETARRRPWRAVAEPPLEKQKYGLSASTLLACPSDTAAKQLVEPLDPYRVLTAGRLRLFTFIDSAAQVGE